MMFRSGWAQKKNQEVILGIWLKRTAFEWYLSLASTKGGSRFADGKNLVRLQWDPDHAPNGEPVRDRRAIQLGLKRMESFINGDDIVDIQDFTEFVNSRDRTSDETLFIPDERPYPILDPQIVSSLNMSEPIDEGIRASVRPLSASNKAKKGKWLREFDTEFNSPVVSRIDNSKDANDDGDGDGGDEQSANGKQGRTRRRRKKKTAPKEFVDEFPLPRPEEENTLRTSENTGNVRDSATRRRRRRAHKKKWMQEFTSEVAPANEYKDQSAAEETQGTRSSNSGKGRRVRLSQKARKRAWIREFSREFSNPGSDG